MEIRNVLRGKDVSFSPVRPARSGAGGRTGAVRPSSDRLELSSQWVRDMEEQRAQAEAALLRAGKQEDGDSGGILGYMETEEEELDALSEQLDVQMKCLKIAMNIMKGKKVPPEDERYLMEHDPEGYKLAMAMKSMVKEDKEECESVLDDEDREGGGTDETSEAEGSAPAEGAVQAGGAAPVEAAGQP